ncbi:hypothetical protein PWT90_11248 [Aphanocladium album]|nr:hypothetical protein PWT90_11248 [Aphanocladium album]
MQSLQAMGGGTGDAVGAPTGYIRSTVEGRVAKDGFAFFASPEARGWAEGQVQATRRAQAEGDGKGEVKADETPVYANASDVVQKVVLEAAVAGKHETPEFATNVHGIVRSQQLRVGSYGPGAAATFQKKLQSLVGAPKPASAAAGRTATKPAKPAKEINKDKEPKA